MIQVEVIMIALSSSWVNLSDWNLPIDKGKHLIHLLFVRLLDHLDP
jgi:hypothetical protein